MSLESPDVITKSKEEERLPHKGMRIVIAGPPQSGKTIFENWLRNHLPPEDVMHIAAQPDGEGDWTKNLHEKDPDKVDQFRNKGKFSPEFVQWASETVAHSSNRFNFIDVGGIPSEENKQICREADAIIILCRDDQLEKGDEWVQFAEELELEILSFIKSSHNSEAKDEFRQVDGKKWKTEGTVVGLDRGVTTSSETILQLAAYLDETVPRLENKDSGEYTPITITDIASEIGKKDEEIKLPGREPFMGLNWKPEEMPQVYQALQERAQSGGQYLLDGRAPQYLAVNVVHALHPARVALADTKVEGSKVTISGHNEPKGEGSGPLPFHKTDDFEGGTLVEYARDQFTIVDNKEINNLIPPEVLNSKPVYLSGKTANWATAEIAMTYAHKSPAVYLFQPGTGFICVISHSPDHKLGSVIDAVPPRSKESSTNVSQDSESKEKIDKTRRPDFMYGSGRFKSSATNNTNEMYLVGAGEVTKIVLGKDVVLTLPEDTENIDPWEPYPTHQEAWLPMWFVAAYHSKSLTPEAKSYIEKLTNEITDEDRQLMFDALLHKANTFWQEYRSSSADLTDRKKYKQMTRILQDVMLYIDAPQTIEDQDEFLISHNLAELIGRANHFRNSERLEEVPQVEEKIENLLKEKIESRGGADKVKQAYDTVQSKLQQRVDKGKVVLIDDTIENAEKYKDIINYDLLIASDAHDEDVVSVVSGLDSPQFYQLNMKSGKELKNEKRRDVIAVPEKLHPWAVVIDGKDSYQPVSMIVATHVTPTTEKGRQMQEEVLQMWDPTDVAHHYLGASHDFLNRDAWGKSFNQRIDQEDLPQIKKLIPIYRVANDLLPRAVYMLKKGTFPVNATQEELREVGETRQIADRIDELFEAQDVSNEELRELYEATQAVFERYFKDEYYEYYLENILKMQDYKDIASS